MADPSATQHQWQEIAATVRARLAKMLELMPAMNPDEVSTLVNTVDKAMWMEIQASVWDEHLEESRRRLEREAAFGG